MSEDSVWVLLAELPFSDLLSDQDPGEEPATGYLFQSLRKLAMSPEYMENIARAVAGFARKASFHTKQWRPESPRRIRIFCQKEGINKANSVKPSRPSHTVQSKELKQIFQQSGVGGWGYFMIARIEAVSSHSLEVPHSCIDLYLYREGE